MRAETEAVFTAALLASVLAVGQAAAIDAADVLDKMQSHERASFIGGAVDMASHLYALNGNRAKADCAIAWYFDDKGSLAEIHAFFEAHKDKDAVGLLSILIDRHCGK